MSTQEKQQPGAERPIASSSAPRLGAPSWLLLGLLAVMPAAFATGLSNFETLKSLLLIGGVALASVLWGMEIWRQRQLILSPGRVTLLSLVFAGYALAASLWAVNSLAGMWHALHFAALAGATLMVSAPVGRPLKFDDFALATSIGALFAGLAGILDYAGVGIFTVIWDPAGPTGAFDTMEAGVAYYVVALPILLVAAVGFRGKLRLLSGLALLVAGVHLSLISTWYWAGIFVVLTIASAVVVGALRRPSALKLIASTVVLTVGVGVLMALGHFVLAPDRAPRSASNLPRIMTAEAFDEESTVRAGGEAINLLFSPDRLENMHQWQAFSYLSAVGAELFMAQPIIGHGAGSWWPMQTAEPNIEHPFVARMFEHYPAFRHPHSAAWQLLVEYGAIGALLFLLWIASAIWVALGAFYRHEEAEDDQHKWVLKHWAMFCAVVAGVVFMLFTPLLSLGPAAFLWTVCLALLARRSAGFNAYRGWSSVWQARAPVSKTADSKTADPKTADPKTADSKTADPKTAGPKVIDHGPAHHKGALIFASVAALTLGLAALVPTVLQAGAAVYRGRADQLMRATAYQAAIEAYQTSFDWFPASSDVPLNIGLASVKLGKLRDAEVWVDRAARMRPHDVRALVLQGRLNLRRSDRGLVVDLGSRAVKAFPNSVEARDLLISALDLQSRYEDAAEQALEMIELNPPEAQLGKFHKLLADLYADFLEKPALAKKHYEAAVRHTASRDLQAKLQQKADKIDELIEQERQMREGKAPGPMPQDAHGHPH